MKRRALLHTIEKSSSASQIFMSTASDDVLWEVFVRLCHAKAAIRCSLVSKRWHSLIHHPHFTAEFSSQNLRRNEAANFQLFFRIGGRFLLPDPISVHRLYSENESEASRVFPNPGLRADIKLSSSSLSLLVFKHVYVNVIQVFNPTTSERLKVPAPSRYASIGIVEDLENLGEYKVMMIEDFRLSDQTTLFDVYVFCSRTRLWTQFTFSVPYRFSSIHDALSSQGVLYFPFRDKTFQNGVLVCSPLEPTRFRLIPRPVQGYVEGECELNSLFGVVSGRLRFSQLVKRERVFSLKIWELRYDNQSEVESDNSWVLVHDVRLTSGNDEETLLFVAAFHPYDGDVVFILRDSVNICRYRIGEGDEYEIVGDLPIPDLTMRNRIKDSLPLSVKAFTLINSTWPTPLGPKLS